MMKKIFNILNILLVVTTLLIPVEALAADSNDITSADVVILVDFSGSITNDIRYPEAEKKALLNLVNVDWPKGSQIAILAFGASDSRNGGKPSTFPMCSENGQALRSVENISNWIDQCAQIIGTKPVGPNTDHNKAIHTAVDLLLNSSNENSSKFVLLMTDGKLDVDNLNPVNPDYIGTSEEKDNQAIEELFTEVLPLARENGIQIWPVGFGDVNRIELNGYAPEGGQPGPESCQREIPRAVIAEPEDLPYEINKIIRQVTCLGEYLQGDNVEIFLPDYADQATINVQHNEGEGFSVIGPEGENITGDGVGTESTIEISNPSGGNWQVVSSSPIEVGYWWESTFAPVIDCPVDSSGVALSISPAINSSDSYVNSPLFDVEVVVDGIKQIFTMELGEEKKFNLSDDVAVIAADASVARFDPPGKINVQKIEKICNKFIDIVEEDTPSVTDSEDPITSGIDCEVTPDIEECVTNTEIPWWLLILLGLSILTLLRYLWNRRYLKEGTFVISNSSGEMGRIRIRKKTTDMVFRINPDSPLGTQVMKAKTGEYGTYEVQKGKNGRDFMINGPASTGTEQDYPFTVGDILILEDTYQVEFEDGFNRKSIVDTNQDPFSNELSNDLFNEKDERPEGENTSEGNPFA